MRTTLKNIIFNKLRSNDEIENKKNLYKKNQDQNLKIKIKENEVEFQQLRRVNL
jgi:hypothetical protein